MTLKGIDVSRWQQTTPPLTGLAFAFAKASEGTSVDPMYSTHIRNFAGLVKGAYMFARDDVGLAVQANAFVAAAGKVDLYAIDVEGTHATSPAETASIIAAVKAQVAGPVLLYHSESGFFTAGQDADWIAHYGVAVPTRPSWEFHQYTSSPYDKDQFNGDLAALHALCGIVPPAGAPSPKPADATMWVEASHLSRLFQRDGRGILRPVVNLPAGFSFKAWTGDNQTETWAPGALSTKRAEAVFRQIKGAPHHNLYIRVNPADMGCTWHH